MIVALIWKACKESSGAAVGETPESDVELTTEEQMPQPWRYVLDTGALYALLSAYL